MSAPLARWATTLAVLAVAVIAAVVSFSHIESLALANGYSPSTGRLLPFSVDGLILAASMALATGTRTALARFGLVLGIVATVTANAVYGASHGPVGVVVNMWPAVAFLVSSEILIGMLRARPSAAPVPESVTEDVPVIVPQDVPQDVTHVTSVDVPVIAVSAVPASTVYPVPVTVPRTVAARPAQAQASRAKRQPDPAKLFAAELAAGKVPSLRAVKEKCHVGTPTAQEIRARLVARIETPQAA